MRLRRTSRGCDAELHQVVVALQRDVLTRRRREIDKQIDPLRRREHQRLQRRRYRNKSLIGADQVHRLPAAQSELKEAGVGGIDDPESVKTRLYLEVREELAVGEDR